MDSRFRGNDGKAMSPNGDSTYSTTSIMWSGVGVSSSMGIGVNREPGDHEDLELGRAGGGGVFDPEGVPTRSEVEFAGSSCIIVGRILGDEAVVDVEGYLPAVGAADLEPVRAPGMSVWRVPSQIAV